MLHHSLAALLLRDKLIPEDKLTRCSEYAWENKLSFTACLMEQKLLSASALANFCYLESNAPWLDLDAFDPDFIPQKFINERLIRKNHAVPLYQRGNVLYIAVSDPTRIETLDEFQFRTRLQTEAVLVEENKLQRLIDKLLENEHSALGVTEQDEQELRDIDAADERQDDSGAVSADVKNDAPIVIYINKMLLDAIKRGASDLHFEPYETEYRVRFRIDGVLHEIARPPVALAGRIAARLKVMAQLNIAERRLPQDGRIKLRLSKHKSIDFRVSSLPTLYGEKIVLRILDAAAAMIGIESLGYEPDQKALYEEALSKPQGMILVTGPTGSGKTVSLYTGLNILNTPERNISTAEDPVEINLNGINQVHINAKAGLNFADALRSFLRQDPDVVMVGEIRDLETAEIAIKAAQTGHLVLSTLHTNSAAETLTRLMNMGVPSYNIAGSVTLIIAQRLARRLCNSCKAEEHLPQDELLRQGFKAEQLADLTIYKAVGCEHCTGGYKGRTGVYEVMPITPAIQDLIMEGGSSLDIAKAARDDGIHSLRESGLLKVAKGIISLAEANRVTNF
ncbi:MULTISPECIES: type IV-A pilus assembly ATPase PilB [Idiomarinaceae]|uniref:Type IV-A pilus assembly ATPase PilB n=2 Tax=Pseudidiomarina TaxID=2800384 RepID=A0AB39XAF8_9GAMM|nr:MULTISPECIES: type IV-A pilus assembly ATPase PilB [Idiomarinaceae]MDX1525739.1 type IV-A pilus assembly ATPase PilB [Pseudidiomarina maritima]MDT7525956.1 type IV-A pilus assembly ATPase PilB [Pseudidiomarina sp. GXY010]MRJ41960.1 type IV-A pilus assembly ATPase PilB [Idiomarina sp. FeN1]NCU57243.1 type IV-A pilus assembly ATPase PilB [Idiomarina sp. FenA--70]NCU59951.1 type IV-A pilus assembly ATPase PilB [Idiomarina sp. FenBw--71]